MEFFRTIRLWVKKHTPGLYTFIRAISFGSYSRFFAARRKEFTEATTVQVHHNGVSFSMVVDPKNGFVDTEIFTHGVYEPDILTVIKKHLPLGGTFVDIGTNIGQHSLFAGQVVGETGSVISFEPIPHIVSQFEKSIALNTPHSQHTVHAVACGDSTDTLALQLRPGNTGGSSFHHAETNLETIAVSVVRADDYLSEVPQIDFIKIDTEGHELEALRGLTQTLAKHSPIILVEFSPAFWKEEVENKSKEFFTLLQTANYELYDLEDGHRKITDPLAWYSNFTKIQTNLLCLTKKI